MTGQDWVALIVAGALLVYLVVGLIRDGGSATPRRSRSRSQGR